MNPDAIDKELLNELKLLNANIVELIKLLKENQQLKPTSSQNISKPKSKTGIAAAPLASAQEIPSLQERFERLYESWLAGQELEVQKELESTSVEDIRKLADANNLNVTTRMSKEKVLNLISIRFREKKLLTSNLTTTKPYNPQLPSK